MKAWKDSRVVFGVVLLLHVLLAGCATVVPTAASDAALEQRIRALEERLVLMESRQAQRSDALTKARGAVAFIWGAYTFVDSEGRPLRYVLNEAGQPIADPQGVPLVDLKGTGSVAYTNYCGTAFLAGPRGELLTNRHVVQPWWEDKADEPLLKAGLRPVFLIFRAFFPEKSEGVPIKIVAYDEKYDIALARTMNWMPTAEPLELLSKTATILEAQPVFLIGYPTGLEAVLAKLDEAANKIETEMEGQCSYQTAERLSTKRLLKPTATSGFLWEVFPHALVYDARTIGGGSGGPVLDIRGRVLGVNAAYLEEFQGGNYGVPVTLGRALLEGRGIPVKEADRESSELQGVACREDNFYSEAAGVCGGRMGGAAK